MRISSRGATSRLVTAAIAVVVVVIVAGVLLERQPALVTSTSASSGGLSGVSSSDSATSSALRSSPSSSSSAQRYTLVWQSAPTSGCSVAQFCIIASLGFAGQASTGETTTTTITGSDNGTTIIHGSTTTIIRTSPYSQTTVIPPRQNGSYPVAVSAFIQDEVTGQNITASSGRTFLLDTCFIQPTGSTDCFVYGYVPAGHTYKVTVYITAGDSPPCSIQAPGYPCSS
jgi:hypothetical protein